VGTKLGLCIQGRQILRVFENWVLRRIFGPKRVEIIGGWRKLPNEIFLDLYFSPSIIRMIKSRRMRWAGLVARMWEKRDAYRILVGKPERGPRRGWNDNITMDLKKVGLDGMDLIYLVQDRGQWRGLVDTVINLRVP
jgi:hypothetical protein